LQNEIRTVLASEKPAFDAYWIPRLNLYFGRWIRHGGFIRITSCGFSSAGGAVERRSRAAFDSAVCRAEGQAQGRHAALRLSHAGHLSRTHEPLQQRDCEAAAAKGRTSRSLAAFVWNAVANPAATFVYNYLFRLGFLDGREGLLLHLNHSVYIHWKFIKPGGLGWGESRPTLSSSQLPTGSPPHPPRWVWRKLSVFNALEGGFYRKYFCFEEPGSQIPENGELMRSRARDRAGRDATRVCAQCITLNYMVAD